MPGRVVKKFSVITPCFNARDRILETVESVLRQTALLTGRIEVEYFVMDGGSTDGTPGIVESLGHPSIRVVSERDRGMYDALAKGLRSASGDVTAYINAGDYYHPTAFDVVADVLGNPSIDWITGASFWYNDRSQITGFSLPTPYKTRLIRRGLYAHGKLQFIQQESTFWLSELNALLDLDYLSRLKLAGDYYLWRQFATVANLRVVDSHLAGFRIHKGQLSSQFAAYKAEVEVICDHRFDLLDRVLVFLENVTERIHRRVPLRRNANGIIRWRPDTEEWA